MIIPITLASHWENTLERTYSDWLESNVHFSRKPGHPGYEQDDSDDE